MSNLFINSFNFLLDTTMTTLSIPYRIMTGDLFKHNDTITEGSEIKIDNIVKYEYYPLDELERSSVNQNLVKYEYIEGEKKGVRACVGCNMEGSPKWFDILEGHTLVGGASRWGKSSFLNTFITYILMTYTENCIAKVVGNMKK